MTLSDISIKNSVFAWMLMASLILFGAIGLKNLGISQMPDADFPVVSVSVTYEGAAPEIIETDVVDVVEDAVMSVQGIRSISSSAKEGEGSVTIEFELDRDIDAAVQEVQTKIAQAAGRLPREIEPPVVTKTNPEDQPIMWVALYGEKPLRDMMILARDRLKDRLQTVSGVGEIILGGYVEPALRIWVNPEKLAAFELTVTDVIDALAREHVEIPAGRIETETKEIHIRSLAEAKTPEEVGDILITKRGGANIFAPIRIRDVAKVAAGLSEVRRISRTSRLPAIGLGIKKQRGSNAVKVADEVSKRLEVLKKSLPPGYKIRVNFDSTKFIKETTSEMKFTLILSALLTAVVCLVFLASWGATLNVLLAIPTSIMGAFLFIYFFGFTLNTFTLLALILAIGIVVDDAIMVLENIVRHQEAGKSPMQAASIGAREITSAATATTLALIAVFIPVVFMKGVIGKFFFQFGITLSVAVALSLLEALTLTPMRASRFLAMKETKGKFFKAVEEVYHGLSLLYLKGLNWCLARRKKVLIGAGIFWVVSLLLLPLLRKEFVPAQDQGMLLMRAQTPLGSSITFTDQKMKMAEEIISNDPAVLRYYAAVGGFGGGDVNSGMLFLTLKPKGERPRVKELGHRPSQQDMMNILRKKLSGIPDFMPIFMDLSTRGFTAERGFPVEFTVRGPEWTQLTQLSKKILEEMRQNPYFTDVDTDYKVGQPEVRIIPRRAEAASRGVSMDTIGKTVNALMGGVRAGKFTEAGHRNDIRVRLGEESRQTADDIKKIFVRNQSGEMVPLSEVVDLREGETLKSITRKDRERAIGIFANVGQEKSQSRALTEVGRIAAKILPENYRIVMSGAAETFKESFAGLFFALILGVIVAYMVLGSQYNSFTHPFTVLLALPFSLSGAFLALLLFDQSLNMYSFIGIILLMGIAKKNSILLVDFTNQKRKAGMETGEAIRTASPQRLRPILMTSFATLAAALPAAMAFGPGAETRRPMALVVIGGVFVSTFFTLFVVPCAYSLLARFEKRA
ncbi:MAG: efflux RND transporter permease subunit [Deltaproteobacteria bacterium]|nr:efflux RND transporter permease subunit [Deltaproteobacteria bacterium]